MKQSEGCLCVKACQPETLIIMDLKGLAWFLKTYDHFLGLRLKGRREQRARGMVEGV